jgi:Glu-tRNA(Gln) amidotransferase subunit E-like FAD-binding protein
MTEPNKNTVTPPDGTSSGDSKVPQTINKEELMEEIKNQNTSLLNTVLEKIADQKQVKDDDPGSFSYDDALKEFEDDLSDLRVDETQAKALLRIFNKVLTKENPKVKNEIKGEIQALSKYEKDKDTAESEVASLYPQILNKKSELFKQSQIEYQKLSKAVRESADGTSVAVIKAANVLGIMPVDIKTIRSMNAMGPAGGARPAADDKVSQKAIDFAASFGVKKDKFEEKLKKIKANSRD